MKVLSCVYVISITLVGCASPADLQIPPIQQLPNGWGQLSANTISNSECPSISGTYTEPPYIERLGKKLSRVPEDNHWLYFGYIPFHLADRKELPTGSMTLGRNNFLIRQPDASQFYVSFLNEEQTVISEYHFLADQGDFECKRGVMLFPEIRHYGMIEGRALNMHVRNALLVDKANSLIIQSTRGPLKGNPAGDSDKFTFEFIRYSPEKS